MGDAVAQAAWAGLSPSARAVYAIDPAPGSAVGAPPAAPVPQKAAFADFAVVALLFDHLEWLWLDRAGHRRARFIWAQDRSHEAAWLVP